MEELLPTQRQLEFIESIEEFVREKFTGTTREEASEYIDRNIGEFKLSSMDSHCLNNGYF